MKNELAFDNVNETKNYKKLVRGSLHTFRGLPAQLLEKSFGELPPDAKQFIIDRICSGLMEFKGAEDAASRIRQVHGIPAQHAAPNGHANDNDSHSLPTQ